MGSLYIMANLLVLWIGVTNYNTTYGQLILTGVTSNFVVVVTNNGRMPDFDPYWELGKGQSFPQYPDDFHVVNPKHANFPFLADWIIIPDNLQGDSVDVSPGDIMIAVGVGWYLWDIFHK